LLEQLGSGVVARQVELIAEQSGSMTTVLPLEATLENESREPDWRSTGAWAGSSAWTHFRFLGRDF
jgi:hypothetical protein